MKETLVRGALTRALREKEPQADNRTQTEVSRMVGHTLLNAALNVKSLFLS